MEKGGIKKKKKQPEDVERDKRLILWSGVTFFMLLIVFGWVFNFKQIVNSTEVKNKSKYAKTDIKEVTTSFQDAMKSVREELGKLKEDALPLISSSTESNVNENRLPTDAQSSTTPITASSTKSETIAASSSSSTIEQVKEKILEITQE